MPGRDLVSGPDRPLISVLIGAYNAAPYLAEAIESVLTQSYRPFELIVVDDGSTDETAEIARSFGDRLRCARQENAGDGAARNAAVRLARGELFAFMDSDDRSTPDRLELQATALAEDPELDMVFGALREFISPELTPEEQARLRVAKPDPTEARLVNIMLIRREAFERVGPFDEQLTLGSPVDWCARADDANLRSKTLPQLVLERRLHLTNLGRRERDARSDYIDVIKAALARRRA